MIDTTETIALITRIVVGNRFSFSSEFGLHVGLEAAFKAAGLVVEREVSLGDAGRIDMLVSLAGAGDVGIGVEVKVGGSRTDLVRQLWFYADHPRIAALVVVTSRGILTGLPTSMNDKPLATAVVNWGVF